MLHPDYFLYQEDGEPLPWEVPPRPRDLHDEDGEEVWLDPERRMLQAGRELVGALMAFGYEAALYRDDPLAVLEFDEAMQGLSLIAGHLEKELEQWKTATSLIENNTQIAPASQNGKPWRPYLSPRWLLHFAENARPGDPPYVPQLLARIAEKEARDRAHSEEIASVCGRPTKSGDACQKIPVFWPGRGRAVACSRHLRPGEKEQLGKAWSAVEEQHSCPGCNAPAGSPCDATAPLRVMPDGEFPRARTFAGRMMHSVRLARAVPAES